MTFKVFAIVPLTFVFALLQMPLINRYTMPDETEAEQLNGAAPGGIPLGLPCSPPSRRHRRRRAGACG